MGFLETLGTVVTAMAEAAIEMDSNTFSEEEKMKIGEVRNILAKKNKTDAVKALDQVMATWNAYSKPSRSLTASRDDDSIWEQKRTIEKKLSKKMSGDTFMGMYISINTTSDAVIVYLNQSYFAIRTMSPTNVGEGAAIVIRNYHIQNVVKGYSRIWADEFEEAINKIADLIS